MKYQLYIAVQKRAKKITTCKAVTNRELVKSKAVNKTKSY